MKYQTTFIKDKYRKKFLIIFLLAINEIFISYIGNNKIEYGITLEEKKKEYLTKRFAIVIKRECRFCGFFSFYLIYLGCLKKYLSQGYIPIIDLQSYSNVYNRKKRLKYNPWELFFYQPYNYTLEEVKKYAKNITYMNCTSKFHRPSELKIYYQPSSIAFWHNFQEKYMPVKKEIMQEVTIIMKKLFNNSKNILGVKLRGTDFLSLKPKGHAIPPNIEQVIFDVKVMDAKYKYDFIFFSTEDESIKKRFIPEFGKKIKLNNPKEVIKYDNTDKYYINLNEKINGNLDYIKNYLINILILSKCLDLVTSRGCGPAGIFILTKGYRNTKVYDLGIYK